MEMDSRIENGGTALYCGDLSFLVANRVYNVFHARLLARII